MYRRFLQLTIAAALVSAPLVLHADPLMTGQFSITGTVENVGTTLMFTAGDVVVGTGTQTGTFLTLLSNGEAVTAPSANIPYSPYTAGSYFFQIGSLTVTLDSLGVSGKGPLDFSGVADLTASGFADTLANYSFSIPASGSTDFTATFIAEAAPPAVPEPSSLALLGSGILGLAGTAVRKFRSARA